MLPKSYIIAKWTVYSLATLSLFALQHLILNHISIFGVTPFIYPMLPALVASYEGLRRGSVFALAMGAVCDMLIIGPFPGFYTVIFAVIGIFAALIGENVLSPGWLCGFTVSLMALALNVAARLALYLLSGELHPLLMGQIALCECILSLPAILPALLLYRTIHRRCAVDY